MTRFLLPRSVFFWRSNLRRSSFAVVPHRPANMSTHAYSLNALKRWSCADNELPAIDKIKSIHVYDFDNTLFASPLPNKQLWQGPTIGLLQTQESFSNGGWWHDPGILKCTGEGMEIEEPRAWHGWWNEQIVELVGLSMQQKDAVNVLLTGRSEKGFAEIIQRMVKSKKLSFDMTVLRPEVGPENQKFASTMKFKQAFLSALVFTYNEANDLRIYEDRPKHVQAFRDFFVQMNQSLLSDERPVSRQPVNAEVIEVSEKSTTLDPVSECAEVQRAINLHNLAFREGSLPSTSHSWEIKKSVFFTGYLISPSDSTKLLKVANLPNDDPSSTTSDTRTLANSIVITPRPCPPHILGRVGGMGKPQKWRAVALGNFEGKVFAAKVEPVPPTDQIYTENKVPMVVLGLRGTGRPVEANRISQWQPLSGDSVIEFDTVVGEKVQLRIEAERPTQDGNDDRGFKRSRPQEEEFPPLGRPSNAGGHPRNQQHQQPSQRRPYHTKENRRPNGNFPNEGQRGTQRHNGGRSGGGGGHGGGPRNQFQRGKGSSGMDGKGRGRGGYPGYRSLDDDVRRKGNAFGNDGANDSGLSY